ncbi:hypothetical protein GCM10027589_15150 [Actinocorallia lasiicapitis]
MKAMSKLSRAAFSVAAAAALVVGLPSAPASAAPYKPDDKVDYKDCPALPAGAISLLWHCFSINMHHAKVKFGSIKKTLDSPTTMAIAMGPDGTTISGGAGLPMTPGAVLTKFDVDGTTATVYVTNVVKKPGSTFPDEIWIRVKLDDWYLGADCTIGTKVGDPDEHLIQIKINIGLPRIEYLNWVPVLATEIGDDNFSLPGAQDCGWPQNGLVNDEVGLKSGWTSGNSIKYTTYVRVKNYALGNIMPYLW